jgi:hypothetical protein
VGGFELGRPIVGGKKDLSIESGITKELLNFYDCVFEYRLELAIVGLGASCGMNAEDEVRVAVANNSHLWVKSSKNSLVSLCSLKKVLAYMPRLKASGIDTAKPNLLFFPRRTLPFPQDISSRAAALSVAATPSETS